MTQTNREFEHHHDIAVTNELYDMLRLVSTCTIVEGAFHRNVEI